MAALADFDPRRAGAACVPCGALGAVDALAIADPPVHARQRKLSNKAFSMRRVAALEPAIRALAEERIGAILPQVGAGWSSADWMREVAVPIPMTVIARMIGLPSEDIPQLKRWSDAAVSLLSGVNTPAQLAESARQAGALAAYFGQRVDEAVGILLQILTAGNESTTSLIGSALLLLLEDPDVERRIRADRALLEPVIEEALRLESPFHGHFRIVRRDTEVAGRPLPAGSRVMLLWGAANRDGDEFPNPDAIDLARRGPPARQRGRRQHRRRDALARKGPSRESRRRRRSFTQEERRAEAERRLVEAAAQLIGEVGASRVTLAMVGERAGYSRGLATHHFGSKGALMQRVVDVVTERFREALTRASRPGSFMEELLGLVRIHFEIVADLPPLHRARLVLIADAMATGSPEVRPATAILGVLRGVAFQSMLDEEVDLDACRKEVEQLLVARLRPETESGAQRNRKGGSR